MTSWGERALAGAFPAVIVLAAVACAPGCIDGAGIGQAALIRLGAWALLGVRLWRGAGAIGSGVLDWPVLAFLSAAGLATAYSWDVRASFLGVDPGRVWSVWGLSALGALYWAASRLNPESSRRRLFEAVCAATAFILAVTPFLPYAASRPCGTLGSPAHHAAWLCIAVPLLLSGLALERGMAKRFAWLLFLVLAFYQLLDTGSRSGLLAATAGVLLWLALNRGELAARRREAAGLGAVSLGGLLALALCGGLGPELADSLRGANAALLARLELAKLCATILFNTFGLGSGPDTFGLAALRYGAPPHLHGWSWTSASQAPGGLFQISATLGLPGLAACLWLCARLLGRALHSLRAQQGPERIRQAGLLAAAMAALLVSQLQTPNWAVLAFLCAAMGCLSPAAAAQTLNPAAEERGLAPREGDDPTARRVDRPAEAAPSWLGRVLGLAALVGLLPQAYALTRGLRAERNSERFTKLMAAGDIASALAHGEEAFRLDPRGFGHAPRLAEAYMRRGAASGEPKAYEEDLARAAAAARRYRDARPLHAESHHQYAMALMWLTLRGKPHLEEASESGWRAAALSPYDAHYWNSLGEIHRYGGRVPEAIEAWAKAVEVDPQHRKANAWLYRYTPDSTFDVQPQDVHGRVEEPGEWMRLDGPAQVLKIVNAGEQALDFVVERIEPWQTQFTPPEGYEAAGRWAELEPERAWFTVGPNAVHLLRLRARLPRRWGKAAKRCFFLRVRSTSFQAPVDRTVRVLLQG